MSRALCALVLLLVALPAVADNISFVNMFRNLTSEQTGNGSSLAASGTFLSIGLSADHNPTDFTGVTVTYPGLGSPLALSQIDGQTFGFQTALLADQAAMDAAYPFGTYAFDATGTTNDATSFDYTADDYAAQPFLTGTDFTRLQAMNPAAAFGFHFSPYATDANAAAQFIFLTIFDPLANAFVQLPNSGFLPNTTTGYTLAANTLQANHPYVFEVDYSNRVLVASPGADFDAQIGFDRRTDIDFVTGAAVVPEPGSLALIVLGVLAVGVTRRAARNAV
jgi:hypothetical protein